MTRQRCAVTGASGFLGSALCRRLAADGSEIYALTRSQPRNVPQARWQRCDVGEIEQVRSALAAGRPEIIFHLAGLVSGSRSLDLLLPTFTANLAGTVNVLLAALECGCPRIVCLGSLHEPDELVRGAPCSPYAASKYAASAYARMFAEIFGLSVRIARPFMVYGPGQLDLTNLIPYVITQLLGGTTAELSSGRQTFDWVFVDDVVDALLAVANGPNLDGRTIDIGSGVLTSVGDVALGLGRRLGMPEAIRLGAIPDRMLEQTRGGDVEATASLTGWRPGIALEKGLDLTVAWYRGWYAAERKAR